MSELIALARCAFSRHRFAALSLLVIVVLSESIAGIVWRGCSAPNGAAFASIALFISLLPAGAAALGLFDYGQQHDLLSPRSGCPDWLLLSPIASWKIAFVPIVLKTIWVSGIWLLFAWSAPNTDFVPRYTPCLCFSGAMIWLLAIAWRPFRTGWSRLAVLAPSLLLLYASLVLTFVSSQPLYANYFSSAIALSVATYVTAVGLTIHAVKLARTCSMGIIPETQRVSKSWLAAVTESGNDRRRALGSPAGALVWHDLARTRPCIRYTLVLGIIPAIVLTTAFVPLTAASVMTVMVAFTYMAGISCVGIGGARDDKKSIPPYLAASPIDSATIAWTRLATTLGIVVAIGGCIAFVFIGWSVWEQNRMNWYRWASGLVDSSSTSGDVLVVGIRWSIAIVLASAVALIGRLVAWMWVSMIGRTWLQAAVTITASLVLLASLFPVLVWFMHQSDWESAEASARAWLAYLPTVIACLLLTKGLLTIAAAGQLLRSRLATGHAVAIALAVWLALTLAVASAIALLIPDPRVTFVWCLAAATLVIPLARVLLLPVSLSLNRHR